MTSITLFYMNGCYHCEKFRPDWETIKKEIAKKDSSIKVAEYEAAEQQMMQMDASKNVTGIILETVDGYPTIIIKKKGEEIRIVDRDVSKILEKLGISYEKGKGKEKESPSESDKNDSEIVQRGGGISRVAQQGNVIMREEPSDEVYKRKYLKYKQKYIALKKAN